jgi:hypothetical protein
VQRHTPAWPVDWPMVRCHSAENDEHNHRLRSVAPRWWLWSHWSLLRLRVCLTWSRVCACVRVESNTTVVQGAGTDTMSKRTESATEADERELNPLMPKRTKPTHSRKRDTTRGASSEEEEELSLSQVYPTSTSRCGAGAARAVVWLEETKSEDSEAEKACCAQNGHFLGVFRRETHRGSGRKHNTTTNKWSWFVLLGWWQRTHNALLRRGREAGRPMCVLWLLFYMFYLSFPICSLSLSLLLLLLLLRQVRLHLHRAFVVVEACRTLH